MSGNQKPIPPSSINFENRDHCVEDHCIRIMISQGISQNYEIAVLVSWVRRNGAAWLVGSFAILECSDCYAQEALKAASKRYFRTEGDSTEVGRTALSTRPASARSRHHALPHLGLRLHF